MVFNVFDIADALSGRPVGSSDCGMYGSLVGGINDGLVGCYFEISDSLFGPSGARVESVWAPVELNSVVVYITDDKAGLHGNNIK